MVTELFWTVGMGVGLFCFFRGFYLYRKHRILADTPKSSILGLAIGFVEVHGKAQPVKGELINSPVTRSPCLFYRVDIKKFGKDNTGEHTSSSKTVTEGVPFFLDDGTGKVLVDAHGAELDLIRTAWRETGGISLRGIYEAFRDLYGPMRFAVDDCELINFAESLSASEISSRRYSFTEYCLLPGHWYDVAGTCIENPEATGLHDRNMIVKGLDVPTFLISWRSEAEIKQRFRRQAARYILGGATLAILSLAKLLIELGWL